MHTGSLILASMINKHGAERGRISVAQTTGEKQIGQRSLGQEMTQQFIYNRAGVREGTGESGCQSGSFNQGRPACLVPERAPVLFLSRRRETKAGSRAARTHSTSTRGQTQHCSCLGGAQALSAASVLPGRGAAARMPEERDSRRHARGGRGLLTLLDVQLKRPVGGLADKLRHLSGAEL